MEDQLAEALAFERESVIRGREDTGFHLAFGDESELVLDEADAERTALIEQAASELGLELPDPAAVSTCPTESGVDREPLTEGTQLAFGITARALADAAERVPIAGAVASVPLSKTIEATAVDGSPKTIVVSMNVMTNGMGSAVQVTVTINSSVTIGAKSTTESAYVSGSVDVCPDPGGVSRGDIVIVLDGNVGEASSYHAETNQTFDFLVNDDARVTSTELTGVFGYRATGGLREADVQARANGNTQGESGVFSVSDFSYDRTDGSAESRRLVERNLLSFGASTAALVRREAESKWRGGTCIEVEADPESAMVDPDTAMEITATPKHKFDMSNVDATVVATLTGPSRLDKQGQRVRAPASYDYVAGSEFRDQGVIKLKSTSKRGIGEGTATITVKCDEDMECPERKMLDIVKCECVCVEVMACPAGQVWDDEACECVCEPEECDAAERWDTERCECVCDRTCSEGQTLNTETCRCEETCDIDPTFGNVSPDCVWTGTINITGSDSGSVDQSTPDTGQTTTWLFTYDASLIVQDDGTSIPTLDGSVGGSWEKVDVTTFEALGCSMTDTRTRQCFGGSLRRRKRVHRGRR